MARIRSMSRLALLALVLGVFAPGLAGAQNDEPPLSPPGALFGAGQFAHQDGATLYRAICQGCHMPDARGAKGAGEYPALAANPKKPKNAAISAMTKKVSAQENMESSYARAHCSIHAERVHDTLSSGLRRKR